MKKAMKNAVAPLILIMITAKNTMSTLLGIGQHAVEIVEVVETESNPSDEHTDLTPQLAVKYENSEGKKFTQYFNLRGYKDFADFTPAEQKKLGLKATASGKAVGKNGHRIEDPARTEKALSIVAKLALDAGVPEGTECSVEDLVGKSIGINIEADERGKARVRYTMPVDRVQNEESEA